MKIIIDLDGTICSEEKFEDRAKAKVIKGARRTIDILKKKGRFFKQYPAHDIPRWTRY